MKKVTVLALLLLVFCLSGRTSPAQEKEAQPTQNGLEVKFVDADIRHLLTYIAQETGKNIIAGPDVTGKITVSFRDVTVDGALTSILRTMGFDYVEEGNIIRIVRSGQPGVELSTRIFNLQYVDAGDMKKSLEGMVTQFGRMEVLTREKGVGHEKTAGRSDTLILTDTPANIRRLAQGIEQLDRRAPQIMIEARIVEIKLGKEKDIGIRWGDDNKAVASAQGAGRPVTFPFRRDSGGRYYPGYEGSGGTILEGFPLPPTDRFVFGRLSLTEMQAVLKLVEESTDVNLLSAPRLTTLDNQMASIYVGETIPIPTYTYNTERAQWEITGYEQEDIGITLEVTPRVSGNEVVMLVVPRVSELGQFVKGPTGEDERPRTIERTAETQVRVADGETVVIGGLIKENEGETITKVPLLGDLPFLKLFFRRHNPTQEKVDLLIFVTPHIMTEDKVKDFAAGETERMDRALLEMKQ